MEQKGMGSRLFGSRTRLIIMTLGAGFAILIIRLFYLQVVQADMWKEKASSQQMYSTSISANRGNIYDRNMKTLAKSVTVWTVFISPAEMEEDPSYRAWVEGMCRGQCPGGESLPAFSRRVCRAFARLLDWAVASEEEQLVLVVHGGTQMAVMEAFALPSRPYFSWGLPCGQGYVLEAEGWLEHRQLRLLGKRDYTKGG